MLSPMCMLFVYRLICDPFEEEKNTYLFLYKVILLWNNLCIFNDFRHKYANYFYLQDI